MPIYSFEDSKTGEVFDAMMKMAERDQFLADNPHVRSIITKAPSLVRGSGGVKTDAGWNEVLSKVSEAHPASDLAQRHRRRTAKEVATTNAVEKWRKKTGGIT